MVRLSPTIKTIVLFGVLTSLLGLIGYLISGLAGAGVFLLLGFVLNFISYWFSDKIALAMSGAIPLPTDKVPGLIEDINTLAEKMKIPHPEVYIIEDAQPNAFATGRSPEKGVICLTEGLLKSLNKDEITGVVAHELAHIKNRDVLIATIASVMAGAISSIAQVGYFFGETNNQKRSSGTNILIIIVAPIAALLIQLAISRSREYEADAVSAKSTGKPESLANALVKIEENINLAPNMNINPSLASLFIQNPFRGGVLELFSTHPPTQKRVDRLITLE